MNDADFDSLADLLKGLRGIDTAGRPSLHDNTKVVRGYSEPDKETGSIDMPIYPSATFVHPSIDESTGFAYGRCGNPTRLELEDTIALLEGGLKSWAFSSGMAAISTMLKLFKPGDHILVGDDLYGGTYRLMTDIYGKFGLEFEYVDATDITEVKQALRPETKGLFVETPTNPMMKVVDLAALAELIHNNDGLFMVDNTFLTPYFQKPFDFGADIVIHSGTKYLCGHNDILAGFIVIKDKKLIEPLFMLSMSEGGMLSPFDSWLMLRSIKTLAIRLDKQQENALKLLEFLKEDPRVERVYYIGDPEHPAYSLSRKQGTGFGAMISFTTKNAEAALACLKNTELILFAESLGGVETLMTYPLVQTHAAMPEDMRERLGISDALLRLSVGIEDAVDLIADLDHSLQ